MEICSSSLVRADWIFRPSSESKSLLGHDTFNRARGALTSGTLRLMVGPGEIVVIQRGMRFKVSSYAREMHTAITLSTQVGLPDGPSRGCRPPA
jgi:hypothetical protein